MIQGAGMEDHDSKSGSSAHPHHSSVHPPLASAATYGHRLARIANLPRTPQPPPHIPPNTQAPNITLHAVH